MSDAVLANKETDLLIFQGEIAPDAFLRTVCAFANGSGGEIRFGVLSDGTVIGVQNPYSSCHLIQTRIENDISPVPGYSLEVNPRSSVISLVIREGINKPYYFCSKAYLRTGSDTVEADQEALFRLRSSASRQSFEETSASVQQLTFSLLGSGLKTSLGIRSYSKDVMKALGLFSDQHGFNHAAELFADVNAFPGIRIVRFGETIDIVLDRESYGHVSLISLYDSALAAFRKYYQYEKIRGSETEKVELIPEDAFRQALTASFRHKCWDSPDEIVIEMHPGRIEITFPGGNHPLLSSEASPTGEMVVPPNLIISNILILLHIAERHNEGFRRIYDAYCASDVKPSVQAGGSTVRFILPVMKAHTNLDRDEDLLYRLLKGKSMSSSELAKLSGFGKTKVVYLLKTLTESGYVRTSGTGRGTKYSV